MKKFIFVSFLVSGLSYASEMTPYEELVEKYKQCAVHASTPEEQMKCVEEYLVFDWFKDCSDKARTSYEKDFDNCRSLEISCREISSPSNCAEKADQCRANAREDFNRQEDRCLVAHSDSSRAAQSTADAIKAEAASNIL